MPRRFLSSWLHTVGFGLSASRKQTCLHERSVVCIQHSLAWLRKCGKEPPFIVFVTLFSMRGYKISKVFPGDGGAGGFQGAINYLPGLLFEQHIPATRDELAVALKPVIDTVWQAAGSSQSPFYNWRTVAGTNVTIRG